MVKLTSSSSCSSSMTWSVDGQPGPIRGKVEARNEANRQWLHSSASSHNYTRPALAVYTSPAVMATTTEHRSSASLVNTAVCGTEPRARRPNPGQPGAGDRRLVNELRGVCNCKPGCGRDYTGQFRLAGWCRLARLTYLIGIRRFHEKESSLHSLATRLPVF